MAQEKQFTVIVHQHIDINAEFDEMEYEHYVVEAPKKSLPLKFFECQPCASKRILTLNIEVHTSTTLSMVISGNTWPYRIRLDEYEVPSARGFHDESTGEFIQPCPVAMGRARSCISCGLCLRDNFLYDNGVTIAFPAHGPVRKVRNALKGN